MVHIGNSKELGLSYKSPIPLRSFDFKNSKSCTFMLESKFQVFANKGFLIINNPISPGKYLARSESCLWILDEFSKNLQPYC